MKSKRTKIKRFELEELFFLFKMKKATKEDFKFYLQESNHLSFYNPNIYLNQISKNLKGNYLKGFRVYAKNVLKDNPQLLTNLDKQYLNRLSSSDLLAKIKEYFYKKESDEITKFTIKYNIDLVINEKKKEVGNANYELLFYLYMFSILQTEENNFYIESATQLLNLNENENENANNFRNLLKALELEEINKQIILDKLKEDTTNNKYISFIQVFECVTKPIKDGKYFEFNKIKELFKNSAFTPKESKTMVEIILNYFNTLKLGEEKNKQLLIQSLDLNLNKQHPNLDKNQELFSQIYLFFINNKAPNNINELLIKWFFTNVHKYNIKIQDLNELVLKNIIRIILQNIEILNNDFSCQILAKFLIQICLNQKIPNFPTVRKFYLIFKELFNIILYCHNFPIELKFAIYYFKLMYKRMKLERMSMIKLDSQKDNLYFDVYCVFIIIFNKLALKVQKKKIFSNLIQTFKDNKVVYPFKYSDISFNPNSVKGVHNEYNTLNMYCSRKLINYIKLKSSIIDKRSGNSTNYYLSQLQENHSYDILFVEIIQDDIPQFQGKYFLKQVEILIQKKICMYNLLGYFTINKEKNKHILLYDTLSECWFSMEENKWDNHLTFQKDLLLLAGVYIKKNIKNFGLLKFYDEKNKIQGLSNHNDWNYYLQVFQKILNYNIRCIKMDIHLYIQLFSLDNKHYLEKFISLIKKRVNLNADSKEKHLLLYIIKHLRKKLPLKDYNNMLKKCVNKYYIEDINTCIHSLMDYLNDETISKKTFQTEKLAYNLQYYLEQFNLQTTITGLQTVLTFLLVLISTWMHLIQNEAFWIKSLKNISFLSSFNPKRISKLNKCYEDLVKNKNNIKSANYLLNKFSLEFSEDYKWKFLSELLIISLNNDTIELHLTSLMKNNIILMFITHSEDIVIQQCFQIFIDYLKLKKKTKRKKTVI